MDDYISGSDLYDLALEHGKEQIKKLPGPYMNEDGDWWVKVEGHSFKQARHEILMCLGYDVPYDGTLVYKGKEKTFLCEEHSADEVGPMCNSTCSSVVLAYHFVENRKW
jgi:hypothetical protein